MAEQANFMEDGYERVQSAFRSMEDEFQKLQKQIDRRRTTFNKRADKQFKKFSSKFWGYLIGQLLIVAIADLVALRMAIAPHSPPILAGLVGATFLLFANAQQDIASHANCIRLSFLLRSAGLNADIACVAARI